MKQKRMKTAEESLTQNLLDAGCGPDQVQQFFMLREAGDINGQMKLLRRQRENLLDEVHVGQKRIDCLDYLVYQMGKGSMV